MPVNKAIGNMFGNWFVEYCWSPLVGGCGHRCDIYCYAKRMYEKYSDDRKWSDKPHWASENFKKMPDTDPVWKGFPKLPKGKIFVCHTTDLFAENIPDDWIKEILGHCNKFPESEFIYQTRNVGRIFDYLDLIPPPSWLGTTIETDDSIDYQFLEISKAPDPFHRYSRMKRLRQETDFKLFITIEPIMHLTEDKEIIRWLSEIKPDLIFIGADSGKNNLPEPSRDELIELIEELKQITHVHVKSNCKRILGNMTLHN